MRAPSNVFQINGFQRAAVAYWRQRRASLSALCVCGGDRREEENVQLRSYENGA